MTNNEELVLRYQQGELNILEDIIRQNENIVCKLASKFYIGKTNSIDIDDLIQEGYIGLMDACNRYDFDNPKKAKFMTYAIYWIYKKMARFIEQKNTNEEVSLQMTINDEGLKIEDTLEDRYNKFEYVEKSIYYEEVREALENIMSRNLTLIENTIIKLNFGWDGECIGISEIADMYCMELKKTIHSKNKALGKIRNTNWARQEWKKRRYEQV
ncbi:sigma-70 family RNA polymerase sigma factor [Niameybacter massiliensis]|uniref:sigma-70 family RNA polymerase sigma factor n=1 Tax=Niameybacter massiliensis TaxID=1658108 RepID=UPI0006B485D4|nr:sigma-70 family RNA polymerase sigma factor [Niameybacter massiliensis]